MKQAIKNNLITVLLLVLLGLIFILWGRLVMREIRISGYTHNVTTQAARMACLKSFGWEPDASGETVKTVLIPNPLNTVYQSYNRLQTPCGFDLNRYCGKTVQCYSCPVKNPPAAFGGAAYVNLLIYKGTVIGGDCMSTAIDGVMLPLDRRLTNSIKKITKLRCSSRHRNAPYGYR